MNWTIEQQLNTGNECIINLDKYQSKLLIQTQKQYLNCLIDSSSQGVNRRFVLPFENNVVRTRHAGYFLPNIQIKTLRQWLMEETFLTKKKKDIRTYVNVREIAFGQGDDCTNGCLLDYHYPKENDNSIGIDLSKQQALDTDQKQYNKLEI